MNSRQTGFTIIELMITLLVLSILLAAAVPTFRDFTRNNRIVAAQNDLVTAMSVARSEAIRRSADVILCPINNPSNPACIAGNDWTNGWMVQIAGSATVLQTWPAPGGDVTTTADINQLRYQPVGTVAATGIFTIKHPGCTGPKTHRVTVMLAGSPRSETINCT
jgi:type IV fimbrial biogenesis protein FimT